MNRILTSAVLLAVVALGCENKDTKPSSTNTSSANPTTTSTTVATASSTAEPKSAPTGAPAEAKNDGPAKPVVTWKGVGLSTPESVLHDDGADVYLVSNVDGKPSDVDGKGFIARLTTDGKVETLKWIEGGKNKVTLNAPKGMAFMGDHLYVADIDTVRVFDRKTGAPVTDIKIPGASFLNDMTATDSKILVSDTGVKMGAKVEQTGSDAVYAIDKDKKVTPFAKAKDLNGPNGVLTNGDKTWVATFGSGELYSLDSKGKKGDVAKLPKGQLDGLVMVGDDIFVSSWEANAIYRGKPGGEMKKVIEDVKSPADIGYDKKRGRLLVPLFEDNEVRAYDVK